MRICSIIDDFRNTFNIETTRVLCLNCAFDVYKFSVVYSERTYESNVPAKQTQAEEDARILEAGNDVWRALGAPASSVEKETSSRDVSAVRVIKRRAGGGKTPRLLIAVGKSVSPLATKRNLLKRRIRAIMRPVLKTSPFSYKVVAGKGALAIPFSTLKSELLNHV